jgi:hypothetical protein
MRPLRGPFASADALRRLIGRGLAAPGVTMRKLALGLGAALAACAPMRPGPPPVPVTATALPEAPSAPRVSGKRLACLDHPLVARWEARLRNERRHRAATARSMSRGARYLPAVRAIVEEAGLPADLALLPAIESGFRPRVRGPKGSVGLWQLQAPTARRFGLVVNRHRDDRLDPERATRAAVRYLRVLHRHYGDWPLALAAYNAGEGRVDRALRRFPGSTYWDLAEAGHLPPINCDYVPRFLAIVRVAGPTPACS